MNAYKAYLQQAKDKEEFRSMFGELARNARGWMDLSMEVRHLPELLDEDLGKAIEAGIAILHGFYNKSLTEEGHSLKFTLKKKQKEKAISRDFYEQDIEEYGLYDNGSEEELNELIPVIHGGDMGRIYAAIRHGRGYQMEVGAPNPKKGINEQIGLQFHSKYPDRARYYARSAASDRVGVQAILMAKVPRKYVYHNGDSGFGDEYNLPYWNYQYLQDIEVITEMDDAFWGIENYYKQRYLPKEALC